MLNVPTEVQALFKADSVFKNFRVHFPNGENADLNNDDIVSESVSFTESICSAQVFQFGLSERSEIEFECVGVQNIYGMTIECAIEICVDSLGATWISDHAPTGNEAFLDLQVCTYDGRNMYRVPYGRFIVESCPRSQGAMKHRRVTAYSIDGYANASNVVSTILNAKEITPTAQPEGITAGRMAQNAYLLLAGETQNVDGLTLSETSVALTDEIDGNYDDIQWEYNGTVYFLQILRDDATYKAGSVNDINSLYKIEYTMNAGALTDMQTAIDIAVSYGCEESAVRTFLELNFMPFFTANYSAGSPIYNAEYRTVLREKDCGKYFYGYAGDWRVPSVIFPTGGLEVNLFPYGGSSIYTKTTSIAAENISVTKYEQTDASKNNLLIGIKPTADSDALTGAKTYIGGVNAYDLARGIAEVTGQFFASGRDGTPVNVTVSKNNPIAMTPAEYSELWWDEYEVEPVGTVRYTFDDYVNGTTNETELTVGTGTSVYSMSNNYYLQNLVLTEDDYYTTNVADFVQNLLTTLFAPKLAEISFVPVTLDAIGLPYIEAGDYLEIDDADGGTVGTYVLSRTLSGIQVLTDSIESKGGEVLGNGS